MALEEFERKELTERDKGFIRMRSIMDFGMGILWLAMGFFLIFINKFDTDLVMRFGDSTTKIFGGVCIVYGLFRVYRGYKKNYLRER